MPTRGSDRPLVSVLMGVYYRQESPGLLKRSVESILAQTLCDYEFLICDDGSTEAAASYLDAVAARDSRVRLVRPGNALKLAVKLNACARRARGGLLARMDDDDYSAPGRFEAQVAALAAHPDMAFVGSNARVCRDGEVIGRQVFPAYPEARDFRMVLPFLHPTLMFRREAMEAVGGYSEDRRQELCEDYDLLLRMYAKGLRGMNLQAELLDYTAPENPRGSRTMRHRCNEVATRWARFRALGMLPGALPYVIKPVAVGLLPRRLLEKAKYSYYGSNRVNDEE